ncbi:gamma-glutamyltransferase family protein [Wenzhouxiangella sp. C33]|uniref:Gamma-glutamyltransferase family protein n=2 Tax=Wenzhouxiangella limi TaxID=2707351 RepID=A0A845V2X4_9GAMM|nr:gamma-glutamyltransferase family protein [Wenzhouxiangella limi]
MPSCKDSARQAHLTVHRIRPRRVLMSIFLLGILTACATPEPASVDGSGAPRPSAGEVTAGVAAAHPLAVEAGLDVLARGGTAADAAVAVQAMLGLVEPQSSGIGGGAFLLHYAADSGEITAFSGRETAPAGAEPDMFLDAEGEPLSWFEAIVGGRAVGVTGVMPMLGAAQQRFGALPWSALFDASIGAAEDGFEVPQRLARFAAGGRWPQAEVPDVIELFTNAEGETISAGEIWRNPAYGQTLRRMAERGPRTLLEPPISTRIIERASQPPLPGTLVQADFDAYAPVMSEAICGGFLDHRVCVPPPPSSGVALLQMLALLEHTDIDQRGPDDPVAWLQFAEASRLMYADRNQYVADPAFVDVPVAGLLDPAYVAERAELIGDRAGSLPEAGSPPGLAWAPDDRFRHTGTSHFVVVDAAGNVVTMTTSVESIFGTGRTVGGFFLNNQLTDFSFVPEVDGVPVANAVEPGKRPRSSMSPVLVFDVDDRLVAALGSPGGSAILAYNAKTIVGLLAWELSLQDAIDLPNLVTLGENFFGEASKFPEDVRTGLVELGIDVQPGRGEESGLHGVVFHADGRVEGAADPRREGIWRTLVDQEG